MQKCVRWLAVAGWLVVGGCSHPPTAQAQTISVPPEQGRPWVAPATTLPPDVVTAVRALFDAGLSDPRGCEYREMDFGVSEGEYLHHGWVLPASEAKGAERFGIGWDGVIYPVRSVGGLADLARDLEPLTAKSFEFDEDRGWYRGWFSLEARSATRLKAALLLRAGETALAETLWRNGQPKDKPEGDPFLSMATLWLRRSDDQAMESFVRGKFAAAMTEADALTAALDRARVVLAARGVGAPWPTEAFGPAFWQLPLLRREAQRRRDEAFYVPILEAERDAPMGEARVDGLVRDLEQVKVVNWSVPGQTEVLEAPAAQALVEAGNAAVPALLRCLRSDERLTSSRFCDERRGCEAVIPVYEAAYKALFRILNQTWPLFDPERDAGLASADALVKPEREPRDLSDGERGALADQIEAAWRGRQRVDPLERAYATLRDEHAQAGDWLDAVDALVQPANGVYTDYRLRFPVQGGYGGEGRKGLPPTPSGEALRGREEPSVRELLARRFEQVLREGLPNGGFDLRLTDMTGDTVPGKLLLALIAWDGGAHPDEVRRLRGELRGEFERVTAPPVTEHPYQHGDRIARLRMLVRVDEERLARGDGRALGDYATLMAGLTPQGLGEMGNPEIFRLMWRHPDDPEVAKAAERLFAPESPWVPLLDTEEFRRTPWMLTPLVGVPAFQRELQRGLRDTAPAGTLVLRQDGTIGGGSQVYTLDPLAPKPGTTVAFRVCDQYAHTLSGLEGCPEDELYWPEAERDRAAGACREFVERFADHFRYREPEDRGRDNVNGYTGGPPIHFPVLDHPATDEDVQAGRAVFSLPPESQARVVPVPGRPVQVNRPAHHVDPWKDQPRDGKAEVYYHSQGKVWQVEEAQIDGRTERFYGFVGRYLMGRATAGEITFGKNRNDADITPGIEGNAETPRREVGEGISFDNYESAFVAAGEPVLVEVKARNHRSLDQVLPGAMTVPAGVTGPTLPSGVRLELAHTERFPKEARRFSDPPFDYGTWRAVALRKTVRVAEGPAGETKTLLPGEEAALLHVDLRDYFDLSAPGSYRLRVVFHAPGETEATAKDIVFSVPPDGTHGGPEAR